MENMLTGEQKVADTARDDLGSSNFKVTGIGERIKDVVQKIKRAATIRKRKPLFDQKDEI